MIRVSGGLAQRGRTRKNHLVRHRIQRSAGKGRPVLMQSLFRPARFTDCQAYRHLCHDRHDPAAGTALCKCAAPIFASDLQDWIDPQTEGAVAALSRPFIRQGGARRARPARGPVP